MVEIKRARDINRKERQGELNIDEIDRDRDRDKDNQKKERMTELELKFENKGDDQSNSKTHENRAEKLNEGELLKIYNYFE